MSFIRYIVTHEETWKDPDMVRRGFDVDKGTVYGICRTREEAKDLINYTLDCPLYIPFKKLAVWNEDSMEIHDPEHCDLRFDIHEDDLDDGKQHLFLKI